MAQEGLPYALRCPQSWLHPLPWELLPADMVLGNRGGRPKCEQPVQASDVTTKIAEKVAVYGSGWLNVQEYDQATGDPSVI